MRSLLRRPTSALAVLATSALVTSVLAAGAVVATPTAATAAVPPAPSGWTTVFSDDFAGPAGSRVDTSKWQYDIGTGYPGGAANWGTGEIERMTDSTANVALDGAGRLAITPRRDASGAWTSGRIETRRTDLEPPPGGKLRIEASIKQPDVSGAQAAGYWPAFWALGAPARPVGARNWPSVGEIDVLEAANGRDHQISTLHCGPSIPGTCNETTGLSSGERPCPGCKTSFHNYAVEWDRSTAVQQLRWSRDGQVFFTVRQDQVDRATWDAALGHGYFLILNVAIGGGFPDAFGGGPTAATKPGVPMLVDHVAVYSTGGGAPAPRPPAPQPPAPRPPAPQPPAPQPPAAGGQSYVSALNGLCLDVPGSRFVDGAKIQTWTCNGTAAQRFTVDAGRLRSADGLCLDAAGGSAAPGTRIQLARCSTNRAQQFVLSGAGDLVNVNANRCVDIAGVDRERGAALQLWDCAGTANQKWTRR